MLNLHTCCPTDVRAMAVMDSEAVTWAEWIAEDPARSPLQPAPLVEPLRRWFGRHLTRWSGGASAAAQAVAAGPWTQARAHAAGAEAAPWCRCCAARGVTVEGTAQHRHGACPEFRDIRQQLPPRWQHAIATSPNKWLWDRGLVAHPGARYPFQEQPLQETWVCP